MGAVKRGSPPEMPPVEVGLPFVAAFDEAAAGAAAAHQLRLTKPTGSLGRIEELGTWYAGVRGRFPVEVPRRAELVVFAADHGVTAEGVSAYPAAVTAAMVANFRAGGGAVNVLARQLGVSMTVVDVGVVGPAAGVSAPAPGTGVTGGVAFLDARIRAGTGNLRREPAMTRDEAASAVAVGLRLAEAAAARGAEVICGGEMGIGSSTAAAALLAAFSGDEPAEVVGRGTGIDDQALARKVAVVREALARAAMAPIAGAPPGAAADADPIGALAQLGGLEIAALCGLMLGGAAHRMAVVVDGFIAGAAALVAVRLRPGARRFLLLSHLSAERGAKRLCDLVGGPPPLFDLGLRLGEGTGAVLAVPLLRLAVAVGREMATFAGAGVPDRS